MDWARILAFVTGMVDQELLARNEYLAAENRILKAQLKGRLKLSDAERATLGEIGHRLGRKVLGEVANVARPDTILAWYRKLVARKFDGSKARRSPGRPRIKREVEQLIVRMAKENRDWGYDRIAGALANLGYKVCDQTVGNVLQRHALPPAPERKRTTTWPAFIRIHLALLAGTDFLTTEVLTLRGLVTYYVLFFIRLESRRVDIAGITVHPDERWMRDKPIAAGSPWQNCFAERLIGTVWRECIDHLIVFGEAHLRRVLIKFATYYNECRIYRSLNKDAPFHRAIQRLGTITSRPVLGGLHHQYCRV